MAKTIDRSVPFYPNHPDDNHCAVACYRMILEYFLDKKTNWLEADKFTGFKNHKAVWTMEALLKSVQLGLDIRMIDPFDYQKYYEIGDDYLKTIWSTEEMAWQKKHAQPIRRELIPEFSEKIEREVRSPSLDDLDEMLDEGRLVFLTIDSGVLNNHRYTSHAALAIGKTDKFYIIHDPGLPGRPNRRVSREKLWRAMGGKNNNAEMTGFRLKEKNE